MSIAHDRLPKQVIVARGPSGRVYLTRAAVGVMSPRDLPLIVRWSFLLFIGSIAFDVWSSAKLSGFLFFAVYFLYHNPLARKRSFPPIPRVIIWFVVYVAVYTLNGLFLPTEYSREFSTRLFTLVQVIIFLWIASDILKDEKIAKKALLAYSIASVIPAIGLVLSLPGFGVEGEVGMERASAIGINPGLLAWAAVALLGLWLNLSRKRLVESGWMFGSMLVLSLAIVYNGARGAIVMLMFGLSVYLIPYWKNRWRMSTGIVALIAMAGLVYIAANTPIFSERWMQFSEEGNTSSRDVIYAEALDMISERPLLGWKPVEFNYELGSRVGNTKSGFKDAHNLFLHLFLEGGVVGAAPFLIGLWLCGQGAWKARNRNLGLLPMALLVALFAGGMSTTPIYSKALWFVLAVTVAAREERKGRGRILVVRPTKDRIQASSWKLNSSMPGVESGLGSQQRSALDPKPTAKD